MVITSEYKEYFLYFGFDLKILEESSYVCLDFPNKIKRDNFSKFIKEKDTEEQTKFDNGKEHKIYHIKLYDEFSLLTCLLAYSKKYIS